MLGPTEAALPDIEPAGSVGKSENGSLVSGQARHYSKNYVFYARQNVGSSKKITLK